MMKDINKFRYHYIESVVSILVFTGYFKISGIGNSTVKSGQKQAK